MKQTMTLLAATTLSLLSTISAAVDNQLLDLAHKDTRVMTKILETALTNKRGIFGQQIKAQYLYGQGYVFNIHHRGGFRMHMPVPPVAPVVPMSDNQEADEYWDDFADAYADWGEHIAEQALASVSGALAGDYEHEYDYDNDVDAENNSERRQLQQLKQEMKQKLREIKHEIKKIAREQHQKSRELQRKLEQLLSQSDGDYEKREAEIEKIKQQQNAMRKEQETLRKKHASMANQYKSQMTTILQQRQNDFEHKLLSNFCAYSNSLRHLNKDEHVSFVFKNAATDSRQDKIYVFDYTQVQKCQQDGDKFDQVLSKVTHYTF